jgi:hypothetical protein
MDDKGFIFTLDAVLALIPVFIVLITVSGVSQGNLIQPSQQIRIGHQAQDTLDAMAQYHTGDETLIEEMVIFLESNNSASGVDAAGKLAGAFLDKTLPGTNYKLIELNQLNGKTIISKGDMDKAQNVAVGFKNHGNYTFKLYIWD